MAPVTRPDLNRAALQFIIDEILSMAYDVKLADRVREYLASYPGLRIEEKQMFSGLCFMVNQKMCVNVSGENLMCRYDPALNEVVAEKKAIIP